MSRHKWEWITSLKAKCSKCGAMQMAVERKTKEPMLSRMITVWNYYPPDGSDPIELDTKTRMPPCGG
jgi:hypothetical protein